jgi:hypothetical protein
MRLAAGLAAATVCLSGTVAAYAGALPAPVQNLAHFAIGAPSPPSARHRPGRPATVPARSSASASTATSPAVTGQGKAKGQGEHKAKAKGKSKGKAKGHSKLPPGQAKKNGHTAKTAHPTKKQHAAKTPHKNKPHHKLAG